MRKLVVVVFLLVLCVGVSADDKISSQWKCDAQPADQHSIAVGDHEGHAYVISSGKCAPEKGSMGDAKETEGNWTQFLDTTGGKVKNHGIFVVTLSTGDKVFYNYHGTQVVKDNRVVSGSNMWTLSGGTGKFKAVKGQGGCKGAGNADGTSTWNCEGTYSTGK